MKTINQSKQDDPRIQEIIKNYEPKNHLITCFIEPNNKSVSDIKMTDIIVPVGNAVKNKRINILALPDMKVNENVDMSDLKEPLNILKLVPINSEFDHKYTFMICRFCYHNHLSFQDFHEWYKGKDASEEKKNKWITHWNNASDFPSVSVKQIMYVLEKYYPNITKKRELIDFVEQCDISDEQYNEIESLDQTHFENDGKKSMVINIGMGGGKTTQTVDYLKKTCDTDDEKDNFIWMTPNIALADNTFARMKDFKNTVLYNTVKRKEGKLELIQSSKN